MIIYLCIQISLMNARTHFHQIPCCKSVQASRYTKSFATSVIGFRQSKLHDLTMFWSLIPCPAYSILSLSQRFPNEFHLCQNICGDRQSRAHVSLFHNAGLLVGWLFGWSVGSLVGQLVGRSVCSHRNSCQLPKHVMKFMLPRELSDFFLCAHGSVLPCRSVDLMVQQLVAWYVAHCFVLFCFLHFKFCFQMRPRISIRGSVRPSVGPSVTPFQKSRKSMKKVMRNAFICIRGLPLPPP